MKVPYEPVSIRAVGTHDPLIVHRPMIHVRVIGPHGNVRVFGRIDTGSDDTLLPEVIAPNLGIALQSSHSEPLSVVGGGMAVVRYSTVDLELLAPEGPYRWSSLVGFHAGHSTVLGPAGFLEWFRAVFDGRKRVITLRFTGRAPQPLYEQPVPRPLPRRRRRRRL
jgi:hypothetical protein